MGIACRADEALLAHPILGNDESRETIGGVRAILERALDEEEVEAAVEAATALGFTRFKRCLLYTSPSPRDKRQSRMPSSA